jgi:tryptophan synthase beta chain
MTEATRITGHGHFDTSAFDRFLSEQLENYDNPAEAVAQSLAHLPNVG